MNQQCGLIVNSSRAIIYANSGTDFYVTAGENACLLSCEMGKMLNKYSRMKDDPSYCYI